MTTLQERLRAESRRIFPENMRDGHAYHPTAFALDRAADALDARDKRIEVLEGLLAEYGDRVRMARAEPAEKQWAIDEAMGNATNRAALDEGQTHE